MSLLRVASSIRIAATRDSWKPALRVLKSIFKKHGHNLVAHDEPADTSYVVIDNNKPLTFTMKRTSNGIQFSPKSGNVGEALSEAVSKLQEVGIPAVQNDKGLLIAESSTKGSEHDPQDVASLCKGVLISSSSDEDDTWYVIRIGKQTFNYCFEPAGRHLRIHCKKGVMDLHAAFNLSEESSRKIAEAIRYQATVYNKIFDPETYGLSEDTHKSKFKLKRHYVMPVINGVLIVDQLSNAYLVTKDGEYLLTKHEGKISLRPAAAFKSVRDISTIKFAKGEVYKGFAGILERRGYL